MKFDIECRHYTDAVLIAVIGLCALENDVIHAGYLALALYFFRYALHVDLSACTPKAHASLVCFPSECIFPVLIQMPSFWVHDDDHDYQNCHNCHNY